ncbi:MAG: dihydrodipicolinate synthase family protein [Clostridia bacterium]|nr:dihydrodipicolinate synthase family protein [Clostridia bacterium]
MKDGFFPALGTPLDAEGNLNRESFSKQIELMIQAGASGLLCMGSMGNMISIKDEVYPDVAETCVDANNGRLPVMVGVMDNSVARVMDRIYALGDLSIDGVVATTPFYYKSTDRQIYNFYSMLADESYYPVFLYDLAVVTQSPMTYDVLMELSEHPNIAGIKTANYDMLQKFLKSEKDFEILYSGLDTFDKAQKNGIRKNLDGMFTATPVNSRKMYECASAEDSAGVTGYLKKIITLRDEFVKSSVFTAYSYAMNLLGMPGLYQPDYHGRVESGAMDGIKACLQEIGEL